MSRIKIDTPNSFPFSCTIQVRVTDLNYGNHLGNDSLLGMIHESRLQFIQHLGLKDEMDFFGVSLIMADSGIVYKSEAFLGDTLTFSVAIQDISRVGFDMVYEVKNQDQKLVAQAKTGMVCFDYSAKKVTAVPTELAEKFS